MRSFAFLAIVCAGGMLITFYPTIFSGFASMQSDAGDVLLNNLFMEHSYRWAFDRDYPFSYWSPGFFYPAPYALTFSETVVGTAPLYWLLRLGFSESTACQLWILITFILNFASMSVVLRWFGVNVILTAAGAYVFTFGLLRADHLTHQHLMPQYFSPFAIWYCYRFLNAPSARSWFLLVMLSAWQVLASLHLGWFLGFGIAIFGLWTICLDRGSWTRAWQFARNWPAALLLPLLLGGTIVGLYARNFYVGAPGSRAYWEAAMYGPYIDGWFVSTPGSLWADHLTPRPEGAFPEKALFQGFGVYAVMLIGGIHALRRRFPLRNFVVASVGTAFVLGLLVTRWGYDVSLWYIVHSLIPGANAFRAIGRIAYVGYMLGLLGGLIGIQNLLSERIQCNQTRGLFFALLAVLMIGEQIRPNPESFDKQTVFFGPAESLKPMMKDVDAAYVMSDDSMPYYRHEIAAMWAGLWTKTPVTNGFSGTIPPGHMGHGARPTVEAILEFLGPNWQGKLAVIEWGPPVSRRVYEVRPGGDPATRYRELPK